MKPKEDIQPHFDAVLDKLHRLYGILPDPKNRVLIREIKIDIERIASCQATAN